MKANIILFNKSFTHPELLELDEKITNKLNIDLPLAGDEDIEKLQNIRLDIPFDVCWYESTTGPLAIVNFFGYPDWFISFKGILVSDLDVIAYIRFRYKSVANPFEASTFVQLSDAQTFDHVITKMDEQIALNGLKGRDKDYKYNPSVSLRGMLHTIVVALNYTIANGRSFSDTCRIREKVKINGKKEFITIRKLVYIGDKRTDSFTTPGGKCIEYSHRFEIRGHWRTLTYGKVGKDRNGVYNVAEKTWVRPYEKGEKDAPLLKKTRVISSNLSIG